MSSDRMVSQSQQPAPVVRAEGGDGSSNSNQASTLTSSIIGSASGSESEAPHQPLLVTIVPEKYRNLSPSFVHAFSGAFSGIASGIATCPLDVIKTKLQAQGGFRGKALSKAAPSLPTIGGRVAGVANIATDPLAYKGLIGTAKLIFKEDGLRGYYRGLGPIILGYLPTWAVYFTVYEKSKEVFKLHGPELQPQWFTHIVSAMIAGGVSTMCTNPIWVIKTRLMSQARPDSSTAAAPWQYANTFDAARKMYKNEGIRSFYSGLGPALLGLTHVAIQFPLYEKFKTMFTGQQGLGTQHGESYNFTGILAASVLSKVCASSATYPHEVVRTRMQTQTRRRAAGADGIHVGPKWEPRYRGLVHATKTIYLEEGWRAFYVGMGTNMVRAVPASAMTLLTYEFTIKHLRVLSKKMLEKQN